MSEQLRIKSIKIYFRIKCLAVAKWKFLVNCWWFGIYRKNSLGVDLLARFTYLIELFSQVFNFEGASHSLLLGWITIFTISWAHSPINSMNLKKKALEYHSRQNSIIQDNFHSARPFDILHNFNLIHILKNIWNTLVAYVNFPLIRYSRLFIYQHRSYQQSKIVNSNQGAKVNLSARMSAWIWPPNVLQ